MRKASILTALVLAIAITYQFIGQARQREEMIALNVAQLLPAKIEGWEVEDRQVADSPDMVQAVESILRYDSAMFRVYKSGGVEITVYMSYWLPGKVHFENIDTHTPDVCWVTNGWTMEKLASPAPVSVGNQRITLPNYRRFKSNEATQTVLYWHYEGSKLLSSLSVDEAKVSFLGHAKTRLVNFYDSIGQAPKQQLFVRISSNWNLENQLDERPVRECLELLGKIQSGLVLYSKTSK